MRRRSISAATALAVLFSSAAVVAGAAGTAAAADSARTLPVKSTGDVVVDGVHRRVFVSDPESGKIVATDYTGKVVATVAQLPGVAGLALSADSRQLYAAVPGDDSVVAIETRTVTRTARHPIGAGTDPRTLALAGGKIWFGYNGDIGSLDLSGAEPVVSLAQRPAGSAMVGAPLLSAAPAAPDTLVAAEADASSGILEVYDVSGAAVTRTALGRSGSRAHDTALTPDGGRVVAATGGNALLSFRTADLSPAGKHPTSHSANAVAIAPGGTLAAGADASYAPDVHVYRPGVAKAVRQYDFPNTGRHTAGDSLAPGGLAFDPSAGRLFAVSVNSEEVYSLRTFEGPAKALPKLTVNAPAKAPRGKSLKVHGKMTASLPFPAGTEVTVVRTDAESPKGKSLGRKKLGAGGAYSFKDTPYSGGKVTYRVSYAGGERHAGTSASDKVDVSRAGTTLSLDKNDKIYGYGATVDFTAKLGKTYKNRTVSLYADPAGDGKGRKLVKTGKVGGKGTISAKVRLTRDTTVTAVFGGDSRTAPKSAKSWVGTKVKVSTTLTKHYRTAKLAGQKYHYFRKTADPLITTRMTAFANRSELLSLEYYYQGHWYHLGEEYFALDSTGVARVRLGGKHDTGYRMRVRASYLNGSSGDTVNSTTRGPWKYFIFTN
ncbi:YncE family protein [Streptomyces sp. NPDC014894]|uniref:YncE family protein n=1 Tax=Streptomyces sp. NPDC014894 TaxID=3364931 RepID=UPI0036FEC251